MTIALVSVYSGDATMQEYYNRFLYGLLKERKSYQNISHKELPTWEDHVKFIKTKPYKDWFIVYQPSTREQIGSIYLSKENEIGIFIKKKFIYRGYGKKALSSLMEYFSHVKEFKANIAPFNSASICFFVNQGFKYHNRLMEEPEMPMVGEEGITQGKIKQYTYKKTNPYYVEHAQEEVAT